ncbi:MAG: carbohydrate ABC transporter permease [Aggregatilineales bacterium]
MQSIQERKSFPFHIVVFILPALICYTVFMAFPLLDSLRLSLLDFSRDGTTTFVGLQNFERLFNEEFWSFRFWNALENNVVFFMIHMVVQNPLALLLATLLTQRGLKGVAVFRTILFAPTTLSYVIVGFIWSLMLLNPSRGIVDEFLSTIGVPTPILGRSDTALIGVAMVSVWQFMGLPMMLFVAALVSINDELIDAAMVDGANGWRIFWNIKFPLILPTVGIVSILTFVGNFNAFALIYTMQGSQGDPNLATDILGTFFFRTAFGAGGASEPNYGMGTAIATMMFLIILTGVGLYLYGVQRRLVRT